MKLNAAASSSVAERMTSAERARSKSNNRQKSGNRGEEDPMQGKYAQMALQHNQEG